MKGVRVFLSFDVDHDADLAERLLEQSQRGGAGFVISARSEAGTVTDRWSESVRRQIRDADQLIMICGEHTGDSPRMNTELRIAQEERKPYFLLWGRRERMCTMPAQVTRNECMYSWTWEILIQQLSTAEKTRPLAPNQFRRPDA